MKQWIKEHAVNITSVVVAGCALVLTVHQVRSTNYHNRLSVVPILTYNTHLSNEPNIMMIELVNRGLGPAVLTDVEYIEVNSARDVMDMELAFDREQKRQGIVFTGLDLYSTELFDYMTLLPGEKLELLRVDTTNSPQEDIVNARKLLLGIKFGFCYRSLYGDTFYLRSSDTRSPKNTCHKKGLPWPWENKVTARDILGK